MEPITCKYCGSDDLHVRADDESSYVTCIECEATAIVLTDGSPAMWCSGRTMRAAKSAEADADRRLT